MRIPLFIHPNDDSQDANLRRVQHHIAMSGLTGGRGFRQTSKNSAPTRIERLSQKAFGNAD